MAEIIYSGEFKANYFFLRIFSVSKRFEYLFSKTLAGVIDEIHDINLTSKMLVEITGIDAMPRTCYFLGSSY